MELQQVVQFLIENDFMAIYKGKYIVTAKFNKAMTGRDAGLVIGPNKVPMVREPLLPDKKIMWDQLYMQFIMEAAVPARWPDNKGNYYDTNKFSKDGMLAFKKALEVDKAEYPVLVMSTALYYKDSNKYKVAIGRYMTEGIWKTDYQTLVASAESGTIEEHVKQQTESNEWSRFKRG